MTTATVTSPAELETAVLQALTALPRPDQQSALKGAGVERRVWTIPARVRGFTGRADLLAELEVARRSGEATVVQAVTGMGGIGKTTTAIEYAHRTTRSSTSPGGSRRRIRRCCRTGWPNWRWPWT